MNNKHEKERAIFERLSKEDRAAVMREYYDRTRSTQEIIDAYGLAGLKPATLCYAFPPDVSEELVCPYCTGALIRYRASRALGKYHARSWECPVCGHTAEPGCRCHECRMRELAAHEAAIARKRDIIVGKLARPEGSPLELSELSLVERVVLGTIARIGLTSDCGRTYPFDCQPYPVFPDSEMEGLLVEMLLSRTILSIHPDSDIDAFGIDEDSLAISYDRRRVSFRPNVALSGSREAAMRALLSPQTLPAVTPEALALWRLVVYYETIEIFQYRMKVFGFSYRIGKETQAFFEDAIEKLSPGELYAVIWLSAKNAAAYSVEKKVSRPQAGNSVLVRMRSSVDKVLSGQYRRISYERPRECPQSLLSQYFFNSLLGICDRYWSMTPGQALHE